MEPPAPLDPHITSTVQDIEQGRGRDYSTSFINFVWNRKVKENDRGKGDNQTSGIDLVLSKRGCCLDLIKTLN